MSSVRKERRESIYSEHSLQWSASLSPNSYVSTSSAEAPSDEERSLGDKCFRNNFQYGNEIRETCSFGNNASCQQDRLARRTFSSDDYETQSRTFAENSWSSPRRSCAFSNKEPHVFNTKNGAVCRSRYECVNNSPKSRRMDFDHNHHNAAGPLHSSNSISDSPFHSSSKRCRGSIYLSQSPEVSNERSDIAVLERKESGNMTNRGSLSIRRKKNSFALTSKLVLGSVVCFVLITISIDVHNIFFTKDVSKPKIPSTITYGVEHGREMAFPPEIRSRPIVQKISENTNENDGVIFKLENQDNQPNSISLLREGSRPVVDAPKYIPNKVQLSSGYENRPRRPMISYAKTSRTNPAPKFVRTENIEKFVLDDTRPLNDRNNRDLDGNHFPIGKTAIGAILGLSAAITLSVVTILGSRQGRREILLMQSRRTRVMSI